jgi:hypothetical protein
MASEATIGLDTRMSSLPRVSWCPSGRTGNPLHLHIPICTRRPWSYPHHRCMSNYPRRSNIGTTVTTRQAITRMSKSALPAGERSPPRHRRRKGAVRTAPADVPTRTPDTYAVAWAGAVPSTPTGHRTCSPGSSAASTNATSSSARSMPWAMPYRREEMGVGRTRVCVGTSASKPLENSAVVRLHAASPRPNDCAVSGSFFVGFVLSMSAYAGAVIPLPVHGLRPGHQFRSSLETLFQRGGREDDMRRSSDTRSRWPRHLSGHAT